MSLTLDQLIEQTEGLMSLPAITMRLNEMVDDPKASATDIANLISQDPSLTLRLLKLANSPLYGFSSRVDTISRAVTVIGAGRIRELVIASTVPRAFDAVESPLLSLEDFWRHSIYCGLAARLLAEQVMPKRAETVFIAGLLHDVGRLLIFNREPDEAHEAFLLALQQAGELGPQSAERQVLGYDHADVGGELAARWKLPVSLQECIRYHHRPAEAREFPQEVALVHMANSVAHMAELDTRDERDAPPVDPVAFERTGLNAAALRSVVDQAQQQVVEAEALLLGGES
ncbi:metal dependent phosphohydrolase [Thioalkalivibrio sulfidiphilus HL-EbGr7]|uniref:Metal dependent phosphohydrolase n=1 Tax=Thioalkalivibrio sulfidiphilus (strain HL-EbGR7) TaxID=396588 RepID=B8GMC4_THISH|nr:HDOD domain-containing protein [Thioalkalivibrio sulfidiphilus]ACL71756.1 metal dependent phosphohydrolase [Thioalkalivibrio sulfidiphilus HL-EbGr7]